MVSFTQALVATTYIASAVAINIVVPATGGNVTGKFGHHYGYGFLHEVKLGTPYQKPCALLTVDRISTTLVMVAFTPS